MNNLKNNVLAAANFHQCYVIEVAGEAMGVVVQERGGFRFFASGNLARALDRRLFGTPRQVEDLCRRLLMSSREGGDLRGHRKLPTTPMPGSAASGLVA